MTKYNKGDLVRCNKDTLHLTKGKLYVVSASDDGDMYVRDDAGALAGATYSWFEPAGMLKAGDRVRWTAARPAREGMLDTIRYNDGSTFLPYFVTLDNGENGYADASEIEPEDRFAGWDAPGSAVSDNDLRVGDRMEFIGAQSADCHPRIGDRGEVTATSESNLGWTVEVDGKGSTGAAIASGALKRIPKFQDGDRVRYDGVIMRGEFGRIVGSEDPGRLYDVKLDDGYVMYATSESKLTAAPLPDAANDNEPDATRTFAVGDPVKSTFGRTKGLTGVVVKSVCSVCYVEFPGWGDGHDGDMGDGSCDRWRLSSHRLEPAEPMPLVEGDRVRFVRPNTNCGAEFGAVGDMATISRVNYDGAASIGNRLSIVLDKRAGDWGAARNDVIKIADAPATEPAPEPAKGLFYVVDLSIPFPTHTEMPFGDAEAAEAKADELAKEHPGDEYGVFELRNKRVARTVVEAVA